MSTLAKLSSVIAVLAICLAGIVCVGTFQTLTHTDHCPGGNVFESWCGSISEHKNLLAEALLTLAVVFAGVVVVAIVYTVSLSHRFVQIYKSYLYRVRKRLFLLIPHALQELFSAGILNTKVYRNP